jgi:hypothetical protein
MNFLRGGGNNSSPFLFSKTSHKLYLDKRVLVNGKKRLTGTINYENHIELSEWIQELINLGEITINVCEDITGIGSEDSPLCVETVEETPITGVDSNSLDFTISGVNDHTITANVKISATSGNQATINGDGLFVPLPSQTSITANDSTTIDFTVSGTNNHTITGSVIIPALISTDLSNSLILGGDNKLYVATGAQTPITANDSSRIDFTVSGTNNHTITANIIMSALISVQAGNDLILGSDGNLFLDYTTTTDALDIRIDSLELIVINLQDQINAVNSRIDIIENSIILINTRLDDCCTPVTLDVDFSDTLLDLCSEPSSNGKLDINALTFAGSGTDLGSVQGVTLIEVNVPDSANSYLSNSPVFPNSSPFLKNFNLLSGMKVELMPGGGGGTISFQLQFTDTSANIHYARITFDIPDLTFDASCNNNLTPSSILIDNT